MRWHKRAAMLMLIGLLIAGPGTLLPYANAQGDRFDLVDRAINAANAAQAKAAQQLADMTKHMDSMKQMAKTSNEKAMMGMMGEAATVMNSLLEEDKMLLGAITELRRAQNK